MKLIYKMCKSEGCSKYASFNMKGQTEKLYCSKHKLLGMVDIKNKMCIHKDCSIRPTFNKEGEPTALYCAKHKLLDMINVKDKTCIHKDCTKQPSFNLKGKKIGLYCSKHKLVGMVDIKNKTCIFENCLTRPTYNIKGEPTALYCFDHKLVNMINVISKTCIFDNCKIQPNYNIEGKIAEWCFKHKTDKMVNVISKTCKTYLCPTQVQTKYDGYCLFCYINTFPDKPVARNYKTKEFAVVEHVKTKYHDLSWREDKKVQDGCSKRRPDLLLDLGYQIIIVEIDENQHINYDCSCENKRIMELSQDLGHRPIIFIRFNPDDYVCGENKISSCWGNNKNGICVVKKTKQKEWTERLIRLEQQIDYWINPENITDKTIKTVQLFYDI